MSTQKWNLLDHMTDVIGEIGGTEILYGELYEGAYRIFKFLYKKASRRRRSAIYETTQRYYKNLYLDNILDTEEQTRGHQKYCELFVLTHDSGMAVRAGEKTGLAELESILPALSSLKQRFLIQQKRTVLSINLVHY